MQNQVGIQNQNAEIVDRVTQLGGATALQETMYVMHVERLVTEQAFASQQNTACRKRTKAAHQVNIAIKDTKQPVFKI